MEKELKKRFMSHKPMSVAYIMKKCKVSVQKAKEMMMKYGYSV